MGDLAIYNAQTDVTTVSNHRVYDTFGNLTSQTNAAIDCLFGFAGLRSDEASGFDMSETRPYEPSTGRGPGLGFGRVPGRRHESVSLLRELADECDGTRAAKDSVATRKLGMVAVALQTSAAGCRALAGTRRAALAKRRHLRLRRQTTRMWTASCLIVPTRHRRTPSRGSWPNSGVRVTMGTLLQAPMAWSGSFSRGARIVVPPTQPPPPTQPRPRSLGTAATKTVSVNERHLCP